MAKNDTFFKILFAIELALLPLIIYAHNFIDVTWGLPLFVVALFVCRVWVEIFKDRQNFKSQLINSIGAVITFAFVMIFYACTTDISTVIVVLSIVAIVLVHTLKLALFNKTMPEFIDAVSFSFIIFECLSLLLVAFIHKAEFLANIGLISILIAGVVIILYKIYYAFRYTYLWSNIKKLFRRK